MTEENQTITTTTTATASPTNDAAPGPNIKRHIPLYQYGLSTNTIIQPLRRFLGKKSWKEVKAIIYDDSTMKVFEDNKLRDPSFDVKLENVALYLAFGKAAKKYGPPPIGEEECNFISSNNFFAVPESKGSEKVQWFAAKDESGLKDLIQVIAGTVEGKVNPPQLGKGAKFRYTHDDQESKWKTYWWTCAQQQAACENHEENEVDTKLVATPLVAVLEQKRANSQETTDEKKPQPPPVPDKKSSHKSKPTPPLRHQQRDYYNIEVQMPEKVEILSRQSHDGLVEEGTTGEKKVITVRLVNGKRVKDTVVVQQKQEAPESSLTPPAYPPPPVPTEAAPVKENGRADAELELQRQQNGENLEVLTLIKEEPRLISTKSINIEQNGADSNEKKEENIEIVTSQRSAVVNVATTEHTISTITCTNGAATCTTTKETHTLQQQAATTAVH